MTSFQADEIHWNEHGVPVLQTWNAEVLGYKLFECVAFFIDDWFDAEERATRVRLYVWARNRDEAVDVSHSNWKLFCDVPNLLNWWARAVN